jgi:DNA repair protein RadC
MAEESGSERRQKLRDSFIAGEPDAFTDEALLEILLNYAILKGDLQPIAHRLLQEFGDLDSVLASDFDALCKFKGIKSYTATLLKLVNHLRDPQRLEASSAKAIAKTAQQKFFGHEPAEDLKARPIHPKGELSPKKMPVRPRSELFTNSVLKEAIEILPKLPDTDDFDAIRDFIKEKLPFSSQNTRDRYVSYVVNRLFPEGRADLALRSYARIYSDRQELRDACFYRFCKAEPLMLSVSHDLLLPAIGYGQMDRSRIREYLSDRYPSSKVVNLCAKAIVNSLVAGGVARSDKKKISFNYRAPAVASLAFLIHSEFPAPGMYEISWLENSPLIRAMLWDPDRLLPGLYELRNLGLISKISEIDNIRQFTTEFTLDELVDHLKSKAKPV